MLSKRNFFKGSTCLLAGIFAVGSVQPGVGFASEIIEKDKASPLEKNKSEKDSVRDYEKKKDIALDKLKVLKKGISFYIELPKYKEFQEQLLKEMEGGDRYAVLRQENLYDPKSVYDYEHKSPKNDGILSIFLEYIKLKGIHENADKFIAESYIELKKLDIYKNLVNAAYDVLKNAEKHSTGKKEVAKAVLDTFSNMFAKIPEKVQETGNKNFYDLIKENSELIFRGAHVIEKFQNTLHFLDFVAFHRDIFLPLLKYMKSETELEYKDLKSEIPEYNVSLHFFKDLFCALSRIKDIENNQKVSFVQKLLVNRVHRVCLEMLVKSLVEDEFSSGQCFNKDLLYDGKRLFENEYFLKKYLYYNLYKDIVCALNDYVKYSKIRKSLSIEGEKKEQGDLPSLPTNVWFVIFRFLPEYEALEKVNSLWRNESNEVQNKKWIELVIKILGSPSENGEKEKALEKINNGFWGNSRTPSQKWFCIANALYPE